MLETEIIDTGLGITEEKQKLLFVPFMELKLKQNFHQVENFTIGMGLACSLAITNALGGDLALKKCGKKLTNFGFKLPVQVSEFDCCKNSAISVIEDPMIKIKQWYGSKRPMI